MEIPILHEDNHLLVVVKPPDLPTQADASGDPDLQSVLKRDVKRRHGKPGNVYLGLVHRLDRPVGGVVVLARTSKAAARLSDQIRRRVFGKRYLAVIEGCPDPAAGELRDHLLKDRDRNTVRVVDPETPGARQARLRYAVRSHDRGVSLVEVDLRTGRPHQIRVQFASRGHPLVGDRRYGRGGARGARLALWSWWIRLAHPTRGEELTFSAPPPDSAPWTQFAAAIDSL
jgi:23S rRNA pseudouridine1911/1915/1917 synthase